MAKHPLSTAAGLLLALLACGCGEASSPAPAGAAGDGGSDGAAQPAAYVTCDSSVPRDPACPAGPPAHQGVCQPAGLACDYARHDGWDSCLCRDSGDGTTRWRCFAYSLQYDCPLVRPEHGATCKGESGRQCAYLRNLGCTCDADRTLAPNRNVVCACDQGSETWRCENRPAFQSAAEAHKLSERVCVGTAVNTTRPAVDETVSVASATDTEAGAWCKWFVSHMRGSGPPPPSQPPITLPDGSVSGYSYLWCASPVSACVAGIPETLCLTSLRRKPCPATLGALTDCYLTLASKCETVGRACTAMRAAPECLETVVQLNQAVGEDNVCSVPIK
jgi:hypothetical protein